MRILLFLLLSLFTLVSAQEIPQEKVLRITEFGGLNTRSGDFSVKPNEFRILDGVNLNRNPGSISIRFGYDNQGTVTGSDSLVGIFGAYFSDGRQRLFYVIDTATKGYGTIFATNFNSTAGKNLVVTEWPIINKPTFTIFRDKVYITNGSSSGIVYDNEISRPFPLYAPGEPKIVPLNTSGNLNGEYVYVFKYRETKANSFASLPGGDHSQIIRVKNGQVLLKDFTWITGQQGDPDPDSIMIRIYRTKANPGNLDEGDTAYWVGTDIIAESAAELADSFFIDNIADGSLDADTVIPVVDLTRTGLGTGNTITPYGAPMFISDGNMAGGGVTDSVPPNFWGYAYRQAILDTATLLESPLSPPMFWQAQGTDDSVEFGIPNPPAVTTGYKINVYRALVVYSSWDTTWFNVPVADGDRYTKIDPSKCVTLPNGDRKCYLTSQPRYEPGHNKDSLYIDDYFLLVQLDEGDTIYADTLGHDSVALASFENLYDPNVPPTPLDGIITANDRLFGFRGENVYFSDLDEESRWFIFNWITINAQDGDRIKTLFNQRDAIRVGKTKSLYNFYQDANLNWNLSEISQHFGIVAQHSVASGIGGTYYYTDFGVVRETEGLYRDRQFNTELISTKIAALDTLPIAIKESAIGFYHKQMYMLSLPYDSTAGDSGLTYVYFEKANAWARWPNLSFGGATLYSTETALSFLPPDTMYFFKAGQSVIYRMTEDTVDNFDGTPFRIRLEAETVPLFTEDLRFYKSITNLGIGLRSSNSNDTLVIIYKDEEGTTKFTDTLSDSSKRYTILGGRNNALFWRLNLQSSGNHSWGNTILDRLDIYYNETVKEIVK